MCPLPLPYHDCTPYFMQCTLFAVRSTPAHQRSLVVREVAFRPSDGSYLVPNAAALVTPVGPPARGSGGPLWSRTRIPHVSNPE